jgi:hypothetical protein
LSLDKSHRWAASSKSFKKRCCDYKLLCNSTKFAAAHKQEIEHRLSCMAIVTGGQQAAKALKKRCFGYELRAATVQHLHQHTSKNLSLGCKSYAATV